jgi:hypothetical protein
MFLSDMCEAQFDECLNEYRTKMPKTSARRSQLIAKCRKNKGIVRKGKEGARLKRWMDEKWVDTRKNNKGERKPCGTGDNHYCRPSKRVSADTPKTVDELSTNQLKKKRAEKRKVGMGKNVKPV